MVSHDGEGEDLDEEGEGEFLKEREEFFLFCWGEHGEFVLQVGDEVVVGEGGGFDVGSGDATHGEIISNWTCPGKKWKG